MVFTLKCDTFLTSSQLPKMNSDPLMYYIYWTCRNTQIHNLKRQVDLLMRTIELEEEKGSDLEMNSKLLSYGEYRADDQEQMLAEMNKKVASVYAKCIGPNEANIS